MINVGSTFIREVRVCSYTVHCITILSLHIQRCHQNSQLEVLDQVSRLSSDPFQHNRRLSETTVIELKSFKGHTSRSESHSIDQSHLLEHRGSNPDHHQSEQCTLAASASDYQCCNSLIQNSYSDYDNPFQVNIRGIYFEKSVY